MKPAWTLLAGITDSPGACMGVTYFKRYRMELDLSQPRFAVPALTSEYRLVAWNESLLPAHAEVKYQCFCLEMDAIVFPCLGDRDGCQRLMREIAGREGFVGAATWLLEYRKEGRGRPENCGTVQGVRDAPGSGGIQNLGVTAAHRGRGLGTVLLDASLSGFQEVGVRRVHLEVTAHNTGAVRLYHRLGFRRTKTVYKAAEIAYA
jgi:GNAT superfamily N-acetyltransferase